MKVKNKKLFIKQLLTSIKTKAGNNFKEEKRRWHGQ